MSDSKDDVRLEAGPSESGRIEFHLIGLFFARRGHNPASDFGAEVFVEWLGIGLFF